MAIRYAKCRAFGHAWDGLQWQGWQDDDGDMLNVVTAVVTCVRCTMKRGGDYAVDAETLLLGDRVGSFRYERPEDFAAKPGEGRITRSAALSDLFRPPRPLVAQARKLRVVS